MVNSENTDFKIKIILLEDEELLLFKIKSSLEEQSYQVHAVQQISECHKLLSENDFDILILDRMIFQEDSLLYLKDFKNNNSKMAILILSAIDSPFEKANALNNGADDYLAKPFETVELIARIKNLIKRNELTSLVYQLGDLSLSLLNQECHFENKNLNLSSKEFLILKLFGAHPGKIFKKDKILSGVWGYSGDNKTNIVEANINSLRRKIEFSGSSIKIKNTRFIGYWIEI